ncbi:hypothetical protein A1O1_04042 [Capronia coronata CBS 617.96]|uniref:Uncharacterized protein n=1 Tax=Capronia coronata CBS 617.96 TaxID=1182541 RepID=W9YMP8_9EURO|nr:uncharacterized protein A1O1_04042 [Capronia coronata CBS 617.96]EXJ90935.1 hypothetical protein A1O1_04042 [Capronia coronata CBS 617.96]
MVPKPTSAKSQVTEADLAANEALLLHAEAARLAKSWLSGAFSGSDTNDNNDTAADEADLKKEQELFGKNAVQYSETGGVGFQDPSAGNGTKGAAASRGADQTTAFLRKHLLRGQNNSHTTSTAKPRPRSGAQGYPSRRAADSEDEEEGRSGVGKSKYKGRVHTHTASYAGGSESGFPRSSDNLAQSALTDATGVRDTVDGATQLPPTPTGAAPPGQARTTKKRGSSYLDEVLASRAAKKNKKMPKNP